MAKQAFSVGASALGVLYQVCDDSGALVYQLIRGADTTPGGDAGVQDDAPVGSEYRVAGTGAVFTKISDTNSTADWQQLAASSVVSVSGTGVTTATNTDCVNVDSVNCAEWYVTVTDNANPTSKRCVSIKAIHNGTATADATTADFACDDILKVGANFDAVFDVVLSGAGTAQEMCLQLTSSETAGVDFQVTRLAVN